MSLFDRIAQSLDKLLSSPAAIAPEEEQGHLALLEQSSGRIRATLDAIHSGNLVAASSTSEDLLATQQMRYQELVGGPRQRYTPAPQGAMSHTDRLTANGASAAFAHR